MNVCLLSTGNHDVPTSATDARLDGKGYRVVAERGVYMAEFVQRLNCAFEEREWCRIYGCLIEW